MPFQYLDVEGHEALTKLVATQLEAQKRVFVLFFGSLNEEDVSWCPDCVDCDSVVDECIKTTLSEVNDITLIKCYVGQKECWRDEKCLFRTDEDFKLTCIPTLVQIGNREKRLEDQECQNIVLLNSFFFDN
uniref:Thioredoxin domain-containing protein 17 n=1 Tax=Rhabditophanes sp. KR3021 TaxID=114890 RepID=A0AC35TXE6_9BILA